MDVWFCFEDILKLVAYLENCGLSTTTENAI